MNSKDRDLDNMTKSRGDEWSIKIFNCSQNLNECSLARAPQIFALLASSQSKFFFISARARKKIAVLGILANGRKDHSSPPKVVRFSGIFGS